VLKIDSIFIKNICRDQSSKNCSPENERKICFTAFPGFILHRLNPFGQRTLPIVISLSRMLCFGRECASACALDVSAALQGAYITIFPTEVVRVIRAQRDEAYVSKTVCYLHVMASNPHPPPFSFTSPQPIRPKNASDSDFTIEDVILWPGMCFCLRSQCKRCSAGRLHRRHHCLMQTED